MNKISVFPLLLLLLLLLF